jgi:hypothetical protein
MEDVDNQDKDRHEALIKMKHDRLLQIAKECDLEVPAREKEKDGSDPVRIS